VNPRFAEAHGNLRNERPSRAGSPSDRQFPPSRGPAHFTEAKSTGHRAREVDRLADARTDCSGCGSRAGIRAGESLYSRAGTPRPVAEETTQESRGDKARSPASFRAPSAIQRYGTKPLSWQSALVIVARIPPSIWRGAARTRRRNTLCRDSDFMEFSVTFCGTTEIPRHLLRVSLISPRGAVAVEINGRDSCSSNACGPR